MDDRFIQNLGALIRRLAADKPPACPADRNASSVTSAPQTALSAWTATRSPERKRPPTSDHTSGRHRDSGLRNRRHETTCQSVSTAIE